VGPLGPGVEFDLIRTMVGETPTPPLGTESDVWVGPGDDAAVVSGPRLALSSDVSVEGIHFRVDWMTPEQVGFRATAAALSDMAAVGARPIGVLVSLVVDPARTAAWVPALQRGVVEACSRAGASVLGGDLSSAEPGAPVVVDIAAVGSAERALLRSGARPGQGVWVTGTLGGAAACVALLKDERPLPSDLAGAFFRPPDRSPQARWLAERGAVGALIDVSDGLAADAAHIAAASGVKITLAASALPTHPGAAQVFGVPGAIDFALRGGEDYELCLTADDAAIEPLREPFTAAFDLTLTRVGEVTSGAGLVIVGRSGPPHRGGFDHFGD